MRFSQAFILCLCAILGIQCSKVRTEDRRGQATRVVNEPSADAVVEEPSLGDDQAVINGGNDLPPLKVVAEVDVSAMPEGFLNDIVQVSKISATRTLFYTKSGFSWLLDEEKLGVLTKLQGPVSAPAGTRMYVQEGQHFWLFGSTSLAFPSSKQENAGQLTLLNISPELFKDPQHKVLFVGPNSLILSNESKANILTRDGDKIRSVILDYPKQKGQPALITAAGQGEGTDFFWFLTADQLLLLKRNEGNQWNWRVSKFKLDQGLEGVPGQVAMMLANPGDKDVAFTGRTFVLNAGKLYEKDALKLSVVDEKTAAIAQNFTANVQPILKGSCAGCHPGYDTQALATDKAVAYKTHLLNKTMPPAPNPPLSDADTKIILDWYASIPL